MVFTEALAPYTPWAAVVLRVAVVVLFIVHGYPKLGVQRHGTQEFLKSMGLPVWMALFAGVAEFFGGLAILLGFLTAIFAGLGTLWMLSTTYFAKSKLGKKLVGGYELDIVLLLSALALALLGGGPISIDKLLGF